MVKKYKKKEKIKIEYQINLELSESKKLYNKLT